MFFRNLTLKLGIGIQPVTDQGLHHQPGVSQVPGAVVLEGREEVRVEPVGPLLGLRLSEPLGRIADGSSFGHGATLPLH